MSTITTLQNTDNGASSLSTINTNFSNLNTDKLEASDISGKLDSVVAGDDITVDATDPANPIVTNSAPNVVQTTITGNAGTVTNGVYTTDFPLNQDSTGSAATLTTPRTIAGVSFDGSANISLNNNAITNGAGYTGATDISGKQDTLVSGTNIKTVNSTSLLGSGNIAIPVGDVTLTGIQTLTNKTLTTPAITNPTGLDKNDVGLSNVDNTSDATKNSATATLTNKTLTAPKISTIDNTGTLTLPTATGTVALTSDITGTNSGTNTGDEVVVTGAELDTGTDDAKFATAKALADSKYIKSDETVTLTNKTLTDPVISSKQDTITSGTADPTGGSDGDIYFKY